MPPVATTVALPSQLSIHPGSIEVVTKANRGGSVISADVEAIQPLTSVISSVMVPTHKLAAVIVVCPSPHR